MFRRKEAKAVKESARQIGYEERVLRYADLLLKDSDGNPRVAIADEVMPKDAEPGFTTARIEFKAQGDAFYIDEYRDNGSDIVFREYMEPHPGYDPTDAQSPKWLVGMERRKWMRFSPEPGTDIRPFLTILEKSFGELPS